MTLTELQHKLDALYPTRYSHFKGTQNPPFICYIEDGSNNFHADNKVYMENTNVNIELYTKTKDLIAEQKIKDMLNENEIPFEKAPTIFIESEGVFQCVFSITI